MKKVLNEFVQNYNDRRHLVSKFKPYEICNNNDFNLQKNYIENMFLYKIKNYRDFIFNKFI